MLTVLTRGLIISLIFFEVFSSSWKDSLFVTIGGNADEGMEVRPTSDGYVVFGYTYNYGAGYFDALLAKLHFNGSLDWATTIGGTSYDFGYSFQQTFDGGFIVAGSTYSFGAGLKDVLLAKFYTNGSLEWASTLGGSFSDEGYSVQQTFDGGYIVAGYIESYGAGDKDVLLAKYSNIGSVDWAISLGGTNKDVGYSVQQTFPDGGFVLTGSTYSFGDGGNDVLLAKFNSDGSLDWVSTVGGSANDEGYSIQQTFDGGFIVTGYTDSFGTGIRDVLLIKLYPNGTSEWISTLGGEFMDLGNSIQQTFDGGYILTGFSAWSDGGGSDEVLLAKIFSNGSLEWSMVLEGLYLISGDEGKSVQQTSDGGYVVTGIIMDEDAYAHFFLSKVDRYGIAVFNEDCPNRWVKPTVELQTIFLNKEVVSPVFISSSPLLVHENITSMIVHESILQTAAENIENELEVGLECVVYRECYGIYDGAYDSDTCSGKGNCSDSGTCHCFPNYFAPECNVSQCNGFLSNDTEHVCSGHGECIDFDVCVNCTYGYYGEFCELRQISSFSSIFGGTENDVGKSVQQTSDGGYVVTGYSRSFGSGIYDPLVVKFFHNLTLEWVTVLGGISDEKGNSIYQTVDDGGYIVAGYSFGAESGIDALLAKFASNGSLVWKATLNGSIEDRFEEVQQTSDGGCVAVGYTNSYGSTNDILIAKFEPSGSIEWASTLGGGFSDEGYSVQQTFDGGYIVVGVSNSFGTGFDILLLKFDSSGTMEWAATLGGDGSDYGYSVQQTFDGGYIIVGGSNSFEDPFYFKYLGLIAKFHSNGYLDWAAAFGGSGRDRLYSVRQLDDGGYIATGYTESFGDDDSGMDVLIVKFHSDGSVDWATTYGGHGSGVYDEGYSIQQTFDGGFVVTGFSEDEDSFLKIVLLKVYSDGLGCDGFVSVPPTEYYSSLIPDDVFANPIEFLSSVDRTGSVSVIFEESPEFIEFSSDDGLNLTVMCLHEFSCSGTAVETEVCSGHGNCTGVNVCSCDIDYYGEECEVQYCYGIQSNETLNVCSGHGECIGHEVCECETNYTILEDCSFWKCFGKWKNDSTVCNGVMMIGGIEKKKNSHWDSHGNCSYHDHCICEEGYQKTLSCDWECFGDSHWEEEACGFYGNCIDYDDCNCTTTDYIGEYCDIPTCALISSLDTDELGYAMIEPGFCDWWACYGTVWNEQENVCNEGHGDCIGYNLCLCKDSYEGEECETWSCGLDKDDPKTCSGNGKCRGPRDCDCDFGFIGDLCETNILYATVMAPVLVLSGFVGLVILILIFFCCCVCCCCVCYAAVVLVFGLVAFLLSQTFRLKKFSKLKNIDILLQEQQAEENTDIAHIKVNKKLFEIPIKEIKVERLIGVGGSRSSVYLAKWKNQRVAYKCFRTRDVMSSQDSFDEFEREAEIFSSISHPGIVGFFGCTMDPPRVGILMEFCEKGECLEYIQKYEIVQGVKYPMEERFRMLFEICSAMDYLHSRKIVHRDLKCDNVLLNGLEQCKVMDFGLSKISDRLSKQVTKGIGTPFYMAPEITIGGVMYDEKCDVFSFSIMVFMLITGKEPYSQQKGEILMGIEFRVANNSNIRPDTKLMEKVLTRDERWIIRETKKCWSHDPEERPSFSQLCDLLGERKEQKKKVKEEESEKKLSSFVVEEEEQSLNNEEKRDDDNDDVNIMLRKKVQDLENEIIRLKGEV